MYLANELPTLLVINASLNRLVNYYSNSIWKNCDTRCIDKGERYLHIDSRREKFGKSENVFRAALLANLLKVSRPQ